MRVFTFLLVCLLASYTLQAQVRGGGGNAGGGRRGGQNANVGHFYGRVVDAKTNKGVDGATVELLRNRYDSVTHTSKPVVVQGLLTKANGDFSLENLPVFGNYILRITAINYNDYSQPVKFDIKGLAGAQGQGGAAQGQGGNMDQILDAIDKDLGNIKMKATVTQLADVVINATPPQYKMAVDKKVFNVDKNIVAAGGMATDVLKNVPSVNVDIDGNITLRNQTPQIFVDGRPTTLTMDEIPADAIESIEVMTNPSAKYDASGGGGGIINVVLKKNKKVGYNGDLRAGVDSRGKFNGGGDINVRQGKFNFFLNGNLRQRKSVSTGTLDQTNFDSLGRAFYYTHQPSSNTSEGTMGFGRAGLDYFLDNRNTLTLAANYFHGTFDNYDNYNSVTQYDLNNYPAYADSTSTFAQYGVNKSMFRNAEGELDYKHNFAKSGHELTADLNVSDRKNTTNQVVNSYVAHPDVPFSGSLDYFYPENIYSNGTSQSYNFQSDYVNPFTEKTKLEAGIRGNYQKQSTDNLYENSIDSGKTFYPNVALNNNFKYTSEVYAAYAQFSSQLTKKLSYQAGLRGESSQYQGTLYTSTQPMTFTHNFPLSLFPSAFLSYKISEGQSLQANYTRRINRPNFWQLSPYVNRSDSLALSTGNPDLVPEFTSSYEVNYQNDYKGGSFLATVYYKHTTNLITRNVIRELLPGNLDSSNVYTYQNASSSEVYGLDLTNRYNITKWLDFMANVIIYDSKINAGNLAGLSNQSQFSYFGKLNVDIKLPANFSIQLNGDYQSKTIVPPNSGGGGRFGGFNQPVSTANGYIKPTGGMDFAVKKEFLKNKAASITFNMQDVFRTRINDAVSTSQYLTLDYSRLRDPQFMRLTFAYRFGKMDMSLFKKKNMKQDQQDQGGGGDIGGGGGTR
ncbi:outer membrane beta-barrel family protein [Dinghuibacter silviterrae]|uniref:Outer membrane receptor protein involved in Fe transport n=1 Tax=Dinghuibacter silviterrae TaxID=1539049 RepID=A0A4R8DV05_9BACT|nr:outer membrane beta-barrel family protein [Dinghuibacter silviterrae]TDX02240.1 outer membrane receptor protein involved in Fe transport [Dinghuibacter silviterrae]